MRVSSLFLLSLAEVYVACLDWSYISADLAFNPDVPTCVIPLMWAMHSNGLEVGQVGECEAWL